MLQFCYKNGPFQLIQKGIQKGIRTAYILLKPFIYKALRVYYILMPQHTNSTFIIVSQSPVKGFFLLHFKRCTRGANHRLSIPQIKYSCGFMITAFYPAVAYE